MDSLRSSDPGRIGPYRLEGRLGEGGMGEVFLARSPGGREVAVKLIRSEYARDPQFRRRFALEVEAARRVGGFHTAQVVDADTGAARPWLVTAFVDGPSLHEAVTGRGPLDAAGVSALAAGLAEGLAAIHACGLVHRDLKPGNVIMAEDGPRIIDFGIAQVADAGAVTSTGVVVGTFSFMSPEQIRAEQAGPASDVFSLGCVLAYAATGRSPFAAATIPAISHRILHEPPQLGEVTGALRELIGACLAKTPADRPDPAGILAAALAGLPTQTRPPTVRAGAVRAGAVRAPERPRPPDPPQPRSGIRRRVLLLGGLAAVGGATAAAVAYWPESHDPVESRLTGDTTHVVGFSGDGTRLAAVGRYQPRMWDVASGKAVGSIPGGDINAMALSSDGRTLATGGYFGAQLRDAATGVVTTSLSKEGVTHSVAFSPDGRILATGGEGGVRLWDTATGRHTAGLLREGQHVMALAFGPDGKTLAGGAEPGSSGKGPGCWLWEVGTGRTTVTFTQENTSSVAFSPDGRTVATGGTGGVGLWDPATGRTTLTLTGDATYSVAFSADGTTLATAGVGGVRLWDPATGRRRATLTGRLTDAVALSRDGRTVAGATYDRNSPNIQTGCWLWKLRP
ncbi:serine/threonine-protein kinase [Streptomyces sp. NBC_00249]|uniref:WD40 repeat domain-containing serine/threonine protein kinase n=1 Tax=Streptomyces sp. NBC_00249 TaxID=2975690 RepID=UPI0022534C85|nr:serine/threonine-protein kinase [Streptomyces sp. NBC_00249]MCX5198331.1 serine/threonine-protein kinase [Streptomyces sp. NBC_00249]